MIIPRFSHIYLVCLPLCFYKSGRMNQWDESTSLFKLFNNIFLWEGLLVLKRTVLLFVAPLYALPPWILLTNCISFGIMVTHLASMVRKFVSSNKRTRYTSAAYCNAVTATDDTLNRNPPCHTSYTISLPRQSKGALLISSSVDFWYFLISRNATVPGQYFLGLSVFGSLPPSHLALALATAAT